MSGWLWGFTRFAASIKKPRVEFADDAHPIYEVPLISAMKRARPLAYEHHLLSNGAAKTSEYETALIICVCEAYLG